MKKTPIFLGKKENGQIVWRDPAKVAEWQESLQDGYLEMEIRPIKPTRSRKQRGYYWGYIIPKLAPFLGLDNPEEVNEWLKQHFNYKLIRVRGLEEQLPMSIEKLPRGEVEDVYRRIREYFAMMGVELREPNERDWQQSY